MSSNGFNIAASLRSLPILSWRRRLFMVRVDFEVSAAGSCWVDVNRQREAVLLLRHKSLWHMRVAGVTLSTLAGERFTVWFIAKDQDIDAWRRLRVRFYFS